MDISLLFYHLLRLFRHSDVYFYINTHKLNHWFYQASRAPLPFTPTLISHAFYKDVTTNACRCSHRDAGTYPFRAEKRYFPQHLHLSLATRNIKTGSTHTLIRCQNLQCAPACHPQSSKRRQEPCKPAQRYQGRTRLLRHLHSEIADRRCLDAGCGMVCHRPTAARMSTLSS